jgi:Acyl-CoA carboxylase epsilon subunit
VPHRAPGRGSPVGGGGQNGGVSESPLLRVVRGEPSAEELAALVAVLTARAAAVPPARPPRPAWSDPARRLTAPRVGPDAWRRSALPR